MSVTILNKHCDFNGLQTNHATTTAEFIHELTVEGHIDETGLLKIDIENISDRLIAYGGCALLWSDCSACWPDQCINYEKNKGFFWKAEDN